uniref:Uncharacterized protein n=1 Tax=Amphimedon queenslandica TaxID=400682 RepID=A0A1X7V9D3_AMPQE
MHDGIDGRSVKNCNEEGVAPRDVTGQDNQTFMTKLKDSDFVHELMKDMTKVSNEFSVTEVVMGEEHYVVHLLASLLRVVQHTRNCR